MSICDRSLSLLTVAPLVLWFAGGVILGLPRTGLLFSGFGAKISPMTYSSESRHPVKEFRFVTWSWISLTTHVNRERVYC